MLTLLMYGVLIILIIIPKRIRIAAIIKLGPWSYLTTAAIYLVLDGLIFITTGRAYAVFALLVMLFAYGVECFEIKRLLLQKNSNN